MNEDEIAARLEAHRAVIAAIAMVVNERSPGAFADIIEAIATFEEGYRQQNEQGAAIEELRTIRLLLEGMSGALPRTPAPPADSEPS